MAYTLTQAAEATGKSKSTILRAIQSHKISAVRDDLTQGWLIEPAELHRLYPLIAYDAANGDQSNGASFREVELLREMLSDKDRQIESLNRRLESVDEERRATLRQLTALLTDQRPEPERRHWWQRRKAAG